MRKHVSAAKREIAPVLDDASVLLAQRRDLETKAQLLDAFNKHFIMAKDSLTILSTNSDTVDEEFFATLQRVKQIHAECQVLLGNENERLGLELMDQSSRQLNAGYQKLYKWIQKEFKNLNLENPQISSVIRRALRVLSERPTLFNGCLDLFADAREHVLTDAFYSALTGSAGSNEQDSQMKPIEFHAHDPLRYIGDMLAWTHSTTVSEREALENLFVAEGDEFKKGFEAGREAEPWSRAENETFDGQKALGDLVNRNVAGIARALRQRIEQVLQNHEDAVLLYKIANLINFYRVTFARLLGPESSLLQTLAICEESSLRSFSTIIAEQVTSITTDITPPPSDLHTPDFFTEALAHFAALLKSYDSSLRPPAERAEHFQPTIQSALTPFLDACKKTARKVESPGGDILMANCLAATKSTLSRYDFVSHYLSNIDSQLHAATSALIEYQHAFFLHTSGLHPLLSALAPLDDSQASLTTIPTLQPFQPANLSDASQTLDDFLPSALMDAMENLKGLSSTKAARELTAEGAERFCEDFEFVEGKLVAADGLRDEEGGSENGEDEEGEEVKGGRVALRSLFPRTSGEIRVLLS